MTIFNKTVKINVDPTKYTPRKTGIDVIYRYVDGDVWGTFTAGNINNEANLTEQHDINNELSHLKVLQDNVMTWKDYNKAVPTGPLRTTTYDFGNGIKTDRG